MNSSGHLPSCMILTSFQFFTRADSNYLGGKPAWNTPNNMGITKGLLLTPYTRQLVIKEMDFPDAATAIGPLIDSEKPLLCVEVVQHLVLFTLVLTFTKTLEDLAVTRQIVWVFQIPDQMLIHKIQGWYMVYIYGCVIYEVKTMMNPDIQDKSTITSWVKKMFLFLRYNIIITKFWFYVTIYLTWILIITIVVILWPWSQCILVGIIILGNLGKVVTSRR